MESNCGMYWLVLVNKIFNTVSALLTRLSTLAHPFLNQDVLKIVIINVTFSETFNHGHLLARLDVSQTDSVT